MMKHFLLLFASLALLSTSLRAQTPTSLVKGKVIDGEGAALSYATVVLYRQADSAMAKAGYSNDEGLFEIGPVDAGSYYLKVSYVGLPVKFVEGFALASGETKVLPDITVGGDGAELDAVTIVTEKPIVTVKPDMTVFNVEGTVNAVGENAFNLLRKAPGVVVDNNDNLMLQGKSGVRVMIDGKPSPLSAADLANLLKSMSSDQIESFEIITNPGSKYDAEGNAGIINIKLKRDKNMGANATVNLDYSYWWLHRLNGGIAANYRNKKMSAYGSYNPGGGAKESFMHFNRIQNGTQFDLDTRIVEDYMNHSARAGADFFLSPKSTLGVNLTGLSATGTRDSRSTNLISSEATDSLLSILVSNTDNPFSRINFTANLNYRFDNGKGSTFSTDADFGTYRNRNTTVQPNQYLDPSSEAVTLERIYRFVAPTDIDIYTWKADMERPFLKGKLGAGVKTALVKTTNTFDFYNVIAGENVLDTTRSNTFDYTENVNAAYLNYQRQIKKWGISAGLRAEQTNSLGELTALVPTNNNTVERHYLNFFPSGGVTYALTKKQTLRLTYSRRIDRPRYEDLNPFQQKIDELSYREGNPFLRPQYTHNIELGHTAFYTLNTSLSYSRTSDYFTNLTDTIEGTRTFMTLQNLSTRQVVTLAMSYPFSPFKWWNTFTNASVYNTTNNADFGTGKEINLSVTTFNIYHQSTFNLKHDIGLQLSGFYTSPGIWGANFRNRRFIGIEAGATKKVFAGRGMFKVGMSDIFFTSQWRGVQEFGGLYMEANGGWESRQIKVSYTHTFGNNQLKASKKRSTASEEEAKRAGGSSGGIGQ
jgi:hypothetical protein